MERVTLESVEFESVSSRLAKSMPELSRVLSVFKTCVLESTQCERTYLFCSNTLHSPYYYMEISTVVRPTKESEKYAIFSPLQPSELRNHTLNNKASSGSC